ncbi:MAG: hypothetical protein U0470_07940 [Anaerolineae bacterium]
MAVVAVKAHRAGRWAFAATLDLLADGATVLVIVVCAARLRPAVPWAPPRWTADGRRQRGAHRP